jgi:hypothetical protein
VLALGVPITMHRFTLIGLAAFASLAHCLAHCLAEAAPPTEAEFRAQVAAIYGFEPDKLSQPEMQAKSEQLDRFWSSVKADAATTLPLLRQALGEPSQSAFFYYDGSKLLLSLSKERADQVLVLRSIARADLQAIQPTDYLLTVHWFASNGFDTSGAALRILAFPGFKAFIPQHALTLGQNYSLIYMLFPMDENLFVDALSSRLSTERAQESQKSIILALWYACTPSARAALERAASSQSLSSEAQGLVRQLLDRRPSSSARGTRSSLQALREQRRKVMSSPISDESLIEFDKLTERILAQQ